MSTAPTKSRHRERRLGNRRTEEGSSRDASEEDNDNDVSDVGSLISVHAPLSNASTASSSPRAALTSTLPPHASISSLPASVSAKRAANAAKRVEELSGNASEGMDSPTYDGDVESSSTIGGTPIHSHFPHSLAHSTSSGHVRRSSSPTPAGLTTSTTQTLSPLNRVPTPKASRANLADPTPSAYDETSHPTDVPVGHSEALSPPRKSQIQPLSAKPSNSAMGPQRMMNRPKELPEDDIRAFVQCAIDGTGEDESGRKRDWKTAPPPADRPVRIYADGVYDLFHFGHALQLRQAKLSFPSVHLLVGVCSDKLCADHKSAPAMTHAERCESVRHCRWADEILPDAPWIVDQNWLDKHQIDYIAHDEMVYPSAGHEDVYGFAKEQGKFLPTRRTPAISTSDLLERIVRGYRDGFFDSKLEKNGLLELMAEDVDWDSSASVEKRERRKKKIQALASGLTSGQSTPP